MERSRASDMPSPELKAAAAHAAGLARDRFGVRRAALFWRDAVSGGLVCIGTAGEGGADGWLGERLAAGVGMAGRAIAEGRPVWSPDLLADPRVPIAAWLRARLEREALRMVAAAPFQVGGVVQGALGVLDGPGRTLDDADLGRLGRLADEVARLLARAVPPER